MPLPPALQNGIDDLVRGIEPPALERAARALSDAYRAGGDPASRAARSAIDVAAYLSTRAPATYAAVAEVGRQIGLARPGWQPVSVSDLGAGPGIASWAAVETWPGITAVACVEAEHEMIRAGKKLATNAPESLRTASWITADASGTTTQADLVIVSYLIGELEPATVAGFIRHAWEQTSDTLVIVEPGTTAGYERILAARSAVLEAGGSRSRRAHTTRPARCPQATGATSRPVYLGAGRTASPKVPRAVSRTRSSPTPCSAAHLSRGPKRA